jgi:AcrR family transcriptional regulator
LSVHDVPLNQVRLDILTVASAEFSTYGLGGARLERIVEGTRTSKRMIYYHFESKEGLYKAVLEHVFGTIHVFENLTDHPELSPVDALRQFAEMTFDTFSAHPQFVRLLTLENLAGAPYIRSVPRIAALNSQRMDILTRIIKRGQQQGCFYRDLQPLDVYINLVGMCYYHVANRAGYVAGFAGAVGEHISSTRFDRQRRCAVVQASLRNAMPCQAPDGQITED